MISCARAQRHGRALLGVGDDRRHNTETDVNMDIEGGLETILVLSGVAARIFSGARTVPLRPRLLRKHGAVDVVKGRLWGRRQRAKIEARLPVRERIA